VIFYDLAGNAVNGGTLIGLAPHAQQIVTAAGASARVTADVAVLASASSTRMRFRFLSMDRENDRARSGLVAPYFKNQAGRDVNTSSD
jgi:hypothetical protein